MIFRSEFVYHRRFMKMYAELPEQLVRMVDDKMNYDDLLFN